MTSPRPVASQSAPPDQGEDHGQPHGQGWWLVLALWGEGAYGAAHVNAMADAVLRQSPGCAGIALVTDRRRDGLDPRVSQRPMPAFFAKPADFRRGGYVIKLALFSPEVLPPARVCVYLDLDTAVTGDLGRLAGLVRGPGEIFMLPPGHPVGFGRLRRALFRLTRGRQMAVGNSSILAFRSDVAPNIATLFRQHHAAGTGDPRSMGNDDRFISWAAQRALRPVPRRLGVMFRREFLSRLPAPLRRLRNRLPWVQARRAGVVAVTFNGAEHKPDHLARLSEGAALFDRRGRRGCWSRAEMGDLKDRLAAYCRAIVAGQGPVAP